MADFTGFYFNNIHSSTYHLIRVSNGTRYENTLFPSFEDRTVELVGGAGSIYNSTRYKEKEFSINIAFDSVTEEDFRAIRRWLEPDKIGEFRFDEAPYKAYRVKLRTPPKFDYICFMRQKEDSFYGDQERVYKGEATLDFIAYDPFGYCCDNTYRITKAGKEELSNGINWQALESYQAPKIWDNNLTEWGPASGLKKSAYLKLYNRFNLRSFEDNIYTYEAHLFNPGDFEVGFELYLSFNDFKKEDLDNENVYIKIRKEKDANDPNAQQFVFSTKGLRANDRVLINTNNHSLQVIRGEGDTTLQSFMRYDLFKQGVWQKIPRGDRYIIIIQTPFKLAGLKEIKYNYKYY